jgi:hypothetical protein
VFGVVWWQPARPARLFNKSVRAGSCESPNANAVAIKECYAGAKVAIKSLDASMQLNGPADFSINSHKRARAGCEPRQRRRRKLLETLINAIAIADIHFKQYCPRDCWQRMEVHFAYSHQQSEFQISSFHHCCALYMCRDLGGVCYKGFLLFSLCS